MEPLDEQAYVLSIWRDSIGALHSRARTSHISHSVSSEKFRGEARLSLSEKFKTGIFLSDASKITPTTNNNTAYSCLMLTLLQPKLIEQRNAQSGGPCGTEELVQCSLPRVSWRRVFPSRPPPLRPRVTGAGRRPRWRRSLPHSLPSAHGQPHLRCFAEIMCGVVDF
jgi:hypothetical protein